MEDYIEKLDNLIYSVIYSFTKDKDLIKDLYQEAIIGVIEAKKNYNPNENVKFSTYAHMYIYGQIYKYFNCNKAVKVNKDVVKVYKLILKTKELLEQELKKEPSINEIATYLNIDESIINNVISVMTNPLSINYEYENNTKIEDYLKYECSYDTELNELLESLSEEERKIIIYKYYEGYSQFEIAKLMNMSQSKVSRNESKSLEKMRVRAKV